MPRQRSSTASPERTPGHGERLAEEISATSQSMTDIPYLTTEQMREVDRAMTEDYRIQLIQMMENAGRNLAALARRRFLNGDPRRRRVSVLCGTGGNGGGGMVAARRLHTWGAHLRVITLRRDGGYRGVPAMQLDVLRRMGVAVACAEELPCLPMAELVIDALFGYGLEGAPREPAATLIRQANHHEAPVLSLDVPSGVETTRGELYTPCIRAAATMTLALPKVGLRAARDAGALGELYLADIGVPPRLYGGPALQLEVDPLFAEEEIIRLDP